MARKPTHPPARAKKRATRKSISATTEKHLLEPEGSAADKRDVKQIRIVAHDLSNSLEAILQASYLLNQAKLDANSKRWVELIDTASQEAARLNRELRKHLRAMSED